MDFDGSEVIWCAVGVAVSLALPVLMVQVRKYWPVPAGQVNANASLPGVWEFVRPYVFLSIGSLIIAFVVLAFLGDQVDGHRLAFLAGYASDSTLQKARDWVPPVK